MSMEDEFSDFEWDTSEDGWGVPHGFEGYPPADKGPFADRPGAGLHIMPVGLEGSNLARAQAYQAAAPGQHPARPRMRITAERPTDLPDLTMSDEQLIAFVTNVRLLITSQELETELRLTGIFLGLMRSADWSLIFGHLSRKTAGFDYELPPVMFDLCRGLGFCDASGFLYDYVSLFFVRKFNSKGQFVSSASD